VQSRRVTGAEQQQRNDRRARSDQSPSPLWRQGDGINPQPDEDGERKGQNDKRLGGKSEQREPWNLGKKWLDTSRGAEAVKQQHDSEHSVKPHEATPRVAGRPGQKTEGGKKQARATQVVLPIGQDSFGCHVPP
jgi:hypothetical protein